MPINDLTRGGAEDGDSTFATSAEPVDHVGGTLIDGYRLVRQIGIGGMGEVWLAEQTKPVRRDVALKVVKAGMDSKQVLARFNAERQALALMDHPAIARVFDGGATSLGRPYFVMEYVRGEPISDYCDRHKLKLRQRLDLFLQLCEGVQHAHQKGIIHRDLKPSNVLVALQDDKPVPKIIDFGVAKAMTRTLVDQPLHTEYGALIGTPEYMSPEQAEMTGLDVDTRTDVYALGVILYQLLTGGLPFESSTLRAKGLDEIRRTIREVDPPRPSTRVTTHGSGGNKDTAGAARRPDLPRLATELRGDLDWITMKALEKDRTRRYGAASDLAADIRRHLENQPVLASPPSQTYRLKKFVRRNRLAVTAATALLVVLVAFAATMAVQAQRIADERDRANREASTAKTISSFLINLFAVSDPSEARGNSLTARELLDQGADRIRNELASEPEVQAPLMETIGTVYTNLGLYRAAEPLLADAVETSRKAVGDDDPRTLAAMNQLANLYYFEQRGDRAEPLYRAVVEGRRRVLGAAHADTIRSQIDLASLYAQQKRLAEAEPLITQSLEASMQNGGADHPNTRLAQNILQNVYFQQGRYADAEPLARQVLDWSLRHFGEAHPETLTDMHNLATYLDRLGRYEEAEATFIRAIDGKVRVLGPAHPRTLSSIVRLAGMYEKQKRFDLAEARLLGAHQALVAAGQGASAGARTVSTQLGQLYAAMGQPDKAAQWRPK